MAVRGVGKISALLLAVLLLLGNQRGGLAGEGKTLRRTEDPLILTGAVLQPAAGWPIGQARLFALRNGKLTAIPFQIDERTPAGEYVLPFGQVKNADDGRLDANDELVWMAQDLGDRAGREQLPAGADAAVEFEVVDPVDGAKGWAYLARYPANAPPLSAVDYVRYDNHATTIDTLRYRTSFHPRAKLSFGELVLKPAGGGTSQNLVDRLKIRFEAVIAVANIELTRHEEDFLSETIGWIDGPVRIVRHTVNQVRLWKLKSPKAVMDNVYFVNAFEFPTIVELPFRSDLLMKNPRFRVSSDGRCLSQPRMFYNSRNPNGVKVDGVNSDAEKQLDRRPYTWSVVTDGYGRGAWMNRLVYDTTATPVQPHLYYNDDRNARDAPEDQPGECGDIGYTLENLGQLKKDKLYLKSIMYNIDDYQPKRVAEFLNILDRPLRVAARSI